ncbi:MAG TPA: hypothetical protein VM867_11115 [Xanthobacteraceae bacterium]|nr:hypothetical protein [Xanthobacteraceae bacterium]
MTLLACNHSTKRMMMALCIATLADAATCAFPQTVTLQTAAATSSAQSAPLPAPQLAPPKSYKPLAIKPPKPAVDPTFEAFRKQLADVVRRKDRAALHKLVVSQGFFWDSETGDKASKRKSSFENFAAAVGLNDKEGTGWDIIATAAAEPTLEPMLERKGVMCGPANPQIDEAEFESLIKATGTDSEEWGFPHVTGLEVRAAPQPNAPIIETLGMHLVRVMPEEDGGANPAMLRVVGPSGKVGFVPVNALMPVVFDQLCYIKESGGWKITGYSGSE